MKGSIMKGYRGTILRIDLAHGKVWRENLDPFLINNYSGNGIKETEGDSPCRYRQC